MDSKPVKKTSVVNDPMKLKIAVEMLNEPDKVPQLIEFDQNQPLSSIIQLLCKLWELPDSDNYAIKFSENNNQNYVTENNRSLIKHGSVLKFEHSPVKLVKDILTKITLGAKLDQTNALSTLAYLCSDIAFAEEFYQRNGFRLIINNIETGRYKGPALKHALDTFIKMMDHGGISWDIIETNFINKIASFICNRSNTQDPEVIQSCLSILEDIVLNSEGKNLQVEEEVTIPNLISHLKNKDRVIQQNAIALINAIFLKADLIGRKTIAATLSSRQVRDVIFENLIKTSDFSKILSKNGLGTELAHQLYVLQTLILGMLESKMRQKAEDNTLESQEKIMEIRKIAFEHDIEITPRQRRYTQHVITYSRDLKELGIKCEFIRLKDFNVTPPGVLALDCMLYFVRNYPEEYTKIVLQNSCRADGYECPFGKTSIELVRQLCDILHIGDPPCEQGHIYHPMLFTHDHPFEELFCFCIVLLTKTWKEMKATLEDIIKVSGVVREQIIRALSASPKSFKEFHKVINQLTYTDITQIWQEERTKREKWESHARPIIQLKEKITPDIIALIQEQRLRILVAGTRFKKYSPRGQWNKDKYWFIRLSPNHKVFHYDDCDAVEKPSLEELTNKLSVVDIANLIKGKDCPHMKDRGRKMNHHLAFSLTLKSSGSLNFVAPDEKAFDIWTDGVNALLKQAMTSKLFETDLETLLSLDLKVRLLDLEGIEVPQEPPPIPEEPEDYDFLYNN